MNKSFIRSFKDLYIFLRTSFFDDILFLLAALWHFFSSGTFRHPQGYKWWSRNSNFVVLSCKKKIVEIEKKIVKNWKENPRNFKWYLFLNNKMQKKNLIFVLYILQNIAHNWDKTCRLNYWEEESGIYRSFSRTERVKTIYYLW